MLKDLNKNYNRDTILRCKYKRDILIMQINKQEKSPIKQRILQYIDYKGISKYKFYKESGITRGILDQSTGLSEETLVKFLDYAREISYRWLLFGMGEMLYDQDGDEAKEGREHRIFAHSDEYGIPFYSEADYFTTVRGDYMLPKYANGDIIACKKIPINTFFFTHRMYLLKTEQGEVVTKVRLEENENTVILYSDNKEYGITAMPVNKILELYIIIGVMKIE